MSSCGAISISSPMSSSYSCTHNNFPFHFLYLAPSVSPKPWFHILLNDSVQSEYKFFLDPVVISPSEQTCLDLVLSPAWRNNSSLQKLCCDFFGKLKIVGASSSSRIKSLSFSSDSKLWLCWQVGGGDCGRTARARYQLKKMNDWVHFTFLPQLTFPTQ